MDMASMNSMEEINTIASLLRTFLPDSDDIPLNGSTEQLLQQVGDGLNSSSDTFNCFLQKTLEPEQPYFSTYDLKEEKNFKTKKKKESTSKKKRTAKNKISKGKVSLTLVQPKNCAEDVDSDATIDLSYDPNSFTTVESASNSNFDSKSTKSMKHYACFMCDETFSDVPVYTAHMIGHCLEQVSIKCYECNENFANKAQYNSHRKLSTYELWVDRIKFQSIIAPMKEEEDKDFIDGFKTTPNEDDGGLSEEKNSRCENSKDNFGSMQRDEDSRSGNTSKDDDSRASKDDERTPRDDRKIDLLPDGTDEIHYREDVFSSKERLKKKSTDEADDYYLCSVCGSMFFKYHSFLRHMEDHADSICFRCAICQEGFKAPCLLRYHYDLHHSHIQPFQCRRCLRRFKMKSSLSTHLRFCDVQPGSLPFAEEMQFIEHLSQQRKFQDIEKDDMGQSQYSCPICTVMFDSPEELQSHMMYHDEVKPYKCEECGRGFRSKSMLQKHKLLHKNNSDCKCEICGVQLLTRSGYNAHLRGHRNQEIIQATFLGNSCTDMRKENNSLEPALEILQRLKEKNEIKNDDTEMNSERSPDSLQIMAVKRKIKTYPCPLCGMLFHSGGAKFQAHAKKFHKDAAFIKCSKCSKCFLGSENLARHMKLHQIYTETFPCDECGKIFRRKYALIVHKKMHSFKKFVQCDICGQEFRFVSEVDKHKHQKHRYDRILNIYKCNICGQRFPMLSHLSVHCHCHNVPESKPFECDLCKDTFKTSVELKQHIFKKHDELVKRLADSKFISDLGPYLDASNTEIPALKDIVIKQEKIDEDTDIEDNNSLPQDFSQNKLQEDIKDNALKVTKEHINDQLIKLENLHSEESGLPSNVDAYNWATRQFSHQAKVLKRWTCEVCQKAFSSNSDLKTHRRTHSGETPFKCDFCDRSFKQRGHRKLHIQVVHTKDMPFKCTQCDSSFPTRYRYQVHLKRHSGVREHQCAYCEKGYFTLGKLNEHKKKRHASQWKEEQSKKIVSDI